MAITVYGEGGANTATKTSWINLFTNEDVYCESLIDCGINGVFNVEKMYFCEKVKGPIAKNFGLFAKKASPFAI